MIIIKFIVILKYKCIISIVFTEDICRAVTVLHSIDHYSISV